MPSKKKKAGNQPQAAAAGKAKQDRKRQAGPAAPGKEKIPFPVLALGASAGGLEALEAFFENMPGDSGIAFVIITHTSSQHTSLLPGILGRKTNLAVKEAEEGMPLEPDTVYVAPAGHDLSIREALHLVKRPKKDDLHMPVDRFLRDLAKARGSGAGCAILSGTGTDGTYGVRAIKENEGLTIAQSAATARHGGMPASAVDTGAVDYVLAPAEMPGRIIEYFSKTSLQDSRKFAGKPGDEDPIGRIKLSLARRTRHDFSHYKDGTLNRRIQRRIAVTRCRNASEYLELLDRDEREVRDLFQELLIGVTSFFRDEQAFAHLERHVVPGLIAGREDGRPLRVWVPGCATGEEAYSIAILLHEATEKSGVSGEIQLYATDLDPRAVAVARAGEYTQNIAADVAPRRLRRYFQQEGDRFRVRREIRKMIVFAEQNILRDPPFSHLDLLVCRNLLIYLKTEAQDLLIPLFHHVLAEDGVLFMGGAETVGRFPGLFETLSARHRIFRKKQGPIGPRVKFPAGGRGGAHGAGERTSNAGDAADDSGSAANPAPAVRELLLREFTPACVIVNREGEILHTHGRTGRYLELTTGSPTLVLSDMAREGLRFPLLSALRKAADKGESVVEEGLRVKTDNGPRWLDLTVKPLGRKPLRDTLAVIFQERDPPAVAGKTEKAAGVEVEGERLEALERELMQIRQDYRSVREELESANEDLRSTNEELQSANEELQSSNEELESSREELQSLNEELSTVNSELQNKIEELNAAHASINRVLDSTRIAIVFLDTKLRLQRFTKEAARLINLIESDRGRPLEHISHNLTTGGPAQDAARVMKTLEPLESEVETRDGHWYRMNVMVHRRNEDSIEGVVLTFVNIDRQKESQRRMEELRQRQLTAARRFAETIVDTVRESLLVLDADLQVLTANRTFYATFGTKPEDTVGRRLFEIGNGQWDIPELRRLLERTARHRQAFEDHLVRKKFPDIGVRKMLLNGRYLKDQSGERDKILLAIEDVSDRP